MEAEHDENDEWRRRAGSFGAVAEIYDASRPSYPSEAVDAVLRDSPLRVLDLGAGTGKFTRLLLERGTSVVAVEPSEEMATQLRSRSPRAEVRPGRAEDLPLTDASVDAVVCAQAWHWVEPTAASAEVARVLRPGGTLALVWNSRDLSVDWLREAFRIMRGEEAPADMEAQRAYPLVAAPFGLPERLVTRWTDRTNRDRFQTLIGSFSDLLVLPEDERRVVSARVGRLFDEHPDLVGREVVEVPYITETLLYRRP